MPGNARRSKAAAVATPQFLPLVDGISRGISNLSLSGPQASERRRLWFLPANLPLPPRNQKGLPHSKPKAIDHIPRPRNAFILFKSHFIYQQVLPKGIAFYRKHQEVCRIVSHIWNVLPDEERNQFYDLADEEERLHQSRFPAYEITESNRKTKGPARDGSDMTPEEVTCKRISELVLQDIRGEELATQIREVVGWFDQASLSALSRKKRTKGGDTDFDRIAPASTAKPARKSNKGRANKPKPPPKPRSSSSKKKQSKAVIKPHRALVVNPSRRESFFSDNEWSGDLTTDRNASYTSSELGLPLASVTSGGISTEGSVDTNLHTPFRLLSPFTAGDAVGDSFGWDEGVSAQDIPFDHPVPFEAFSDHWGSIDEFTTHGEQYSDGLYDNYTVDQSMYHGAQHGRCYGPTQLPIDDLFTGNPVASAEQPQTISPLCLL